MNANDTMVTVHTNGSGNSANATLYSCDLFQDDQGQIYVADTLNRRILKFNGNSSILLMETIDSPVSLSIDQRNYLMYISYYNYIIKYQLYPNGTLVSPNGNTNLFQKGFFQKKLDERISYYSLHSSLQNRILLTELLVKIILVTYRRRRWIHKI